MDQRLKHGPETGRFPAENTGEKLCDIGLGDTVRMAPKAQATKAKTCEAVFNQNLCPARAPSTARAGGPQHRGDGPQPGRPTRA